jgi:DNA-binding XRE family transcriptional regulator
VEVYFSNTIFLLENGRDNPTLKVAFYENPVFCGNVFILFFCIMKNIGIYLIFGVLLWGTTYAYAPTSQDVVQINLLKSQFDTITTGNMKDKRDYYAQLKTLQEQFS